MPAFAEAYATGERGPARRPELDDMVMMQDALDGQKRRREISVDRRAPVLFAHLFERSRRRCREPAGVCDEDVDRSQVILDLAAHRIDLGELRDVAENSNGTSSRALDVGSDGRERALVPAVDGDSGATRGERPRDRRADPA
jgi:hypothetical protein